MSSGPRLVELGLAAHSAGRLDEAESWYRRALLSRNDDPEALNLLGVCRCQRGDVREAIALLQRAVELAPRSGATIANLGNALQGAGALEAALACFDRATSLMPANADLRTNRGNVLRELGRIEESIDCYESALALAPAHAGALQGLGEALLAQGRIEDALACYERAAAHAPTAASVHFNYGVALARANRPREALDRFGRALELEPARVDARRNAALAWLALDRPEDALAAIEAALRLQPGQAGLLQTFGTVLRRCGRAVEAAAALAAAAASSPNDFDVLMDHAAALLQLRRAGESLAVLDRAAMLRPAEPDVPMLRARALRELGREEEARGEFERALWQTSGTSLEALRRRGACLHELGREEEALVGLERALALYPGVADLHEICAHCLAELGRHGEAQSALTAARGYRPHDAALQFAEACLRLLRGDFEGGLPHYEARWRDASLELAPLPPGARWTGTEPLQGCTLLLRAEQGLGDTLQFCRYATLLAGAGARVRLELQPPLVQLLRGLQGVDRVCAIGTAPPGHDRVASLLSLPLAFGTRLESIPAHIPYLAAGPEQAACAIERLGPRRAPLRVGLAWSGQRRHKRDRQRSVPLQLLRPLAAVPVEWISLQADVRGGDRDALAQFGLREMLEPGDDFAQTAGLIEHLDLVISVDTAVAHLAGALGAPVWILLPANPDWRWLLEREDSPWYPSARLFRQPRAGDWASVVAALRFALETALQGPLPAHARRQASA